MTLKLSGVILVVMSFECLFIALLADKPAFFWARVEKGVI